MVPKRIVLIILLLACSIAGWSQSLYHINLKVSAYKASVRSVELLCDSIMVRVGPDGNITFDKPGVGDFEYYTRFDGEYRQGKLKSVGNAVFDYYDAFDSEDKRGKLKSISNIPVSYYDKFDGFDSIGKLKSVGNITFSYYDKFDARNIGQLKAIGDTKITYYTQFDGFDNIGKLKTIGNTTITYFGRFDARENLGKIKSVKGNTPYLNIINM